MTIRIGTSGWSYKQWKGTFYPADLPADDMLRHYATRLPTVEINNSFYRMPTERVLLGWAEQVPADFRFVMKASRRITHNARLTDEDGSLEYFMRTVNVLGERLGPTLFQCPPSLPMDLGRLRDFVARIPRTWRSAFEFRHASWFTDDVYRTLGDHDMALVTVEDDEAVSPLVKTASWGYLRLRKTEYAPAELEAWARGIRGQGWKETYVFLKHEEDTGTNAGHGPQSALALKELIGT
jgi:uncharacterized protein YecE (DUF72 family)